MKIHKQITSLPPFSWTTREKVLKTIMLIYFLQLRMKSKAYWKASKWWYWMFRRIWQGHLSPTRVCTVRTLGTWVLRKERSGKIPTFDELTNYDINYMIKSLRTKIKILEEFPINPTLHHQHHRKVIIRLNDNLKLLWAFKFLVEGQYGQCRKQSINWP